MKTTTKVRVYPEQHRYLLRVAKRSRLTVARVLADIVDAHRNLPRPTRLPALVGRDVGEPSTD